MEKYFCKNCNSEDSFVLLDGNNFCMYCGTRNAKKITQSEADCFNSIEEDNFDSQETHYGWTQQDLIDTHRMER